MVRIVLIVFIFSIILPNGSDNYIVQHNDAIGHYNLFLNKINPYRQSVIPIGAIKMSSASNNQPMSSIIPNLNFIGNLDSVKVASQFMYNRGDYAYRETEIMVNYYLIFMGERTLPIMRLIFPI